VAVERKPFSAAWKDAVVAVLLSDGADAAEQMEIDADALDSRAELRGIANLLRDRAGDIRRELPHRQG
jgi:hypothetical protein